MIDNKELFDWLVGLLSTNAKNLLDPANTGEHFANAKSELRTLATNCRFWLVVVDKTDWRSVTVESDSLFTKYKLSV